MREPVDITAENTRLDSLAPRLLVGGAIGGIAFLVLAVFAAFATKAGAERFYLAYLINYMFFLSISLGGLFFVLVLHLTRAGWGVVVRRLSEAVAANVFLMLFLFIPILIGRGHLYLWLNAEYVAANQHDALLVWKEPYLNIGFFIVRCIIYFTVWIGLSLYLLWKSQEQDNSGDPKLTLRMERISAPGTLLFALTVTFAAFDLLMSRDYQWFSTIFGVYFFAGCFVSFLSFLAVTICFVQKSGRLVKVISSEHYHDIGKLMFAFVVFWAYIAYSQFMIIWYGNIPEETGWYYRRGGDGGEWYTASMILLFGHFFIPFLFLIFRSVKRKLGTLVFAAVWMLAIHWFDIFWLVMPEYTVKHAELNGTVPLHFLDALVFLGMGGLFVAGTVQWLRNHALIPEKDPRLAESLAFENA